MEFNEPGVNFDLLDTNEANSDNVKSRSLKVKTKALTYAVKKTYNLKETLLEFPKKGFTYHVVSGKNFDFYNLVPLFIDVYGFRIDVLTVCTWSIFDIYVSDIIDRFDKKQIKKINFLTSHSFARRFPVAHGSLLEQLTSRKQRYIATQNHAKITLFKIGEDYISAEGSPNFTQNPRIEQFIITNNKRVYEFHLNWMEELLK